jgi:hypothetical protein
MQMKMGRKLLIALVAVLVIAQLVPFPPAENPPQGQEVPAPAEVRTILRASCYDCHSNETVWPWYSHVIPTKWLVRGHVQEGRDHLNFSTWEQYSSESAARKLGGVADMVEEGKMPLSSYLRMHPEAVLSPEDASRIIDWARSMGGTTEESPGEAEDGAEPGDGARQ